MTTFIRKILVRSDRALSLLVYFAAKLLNYIRGIGLHHFPHSKSVLFRVGVFPIRDHYYEPQFDNRNPRIPFSQERDLPGIDWNVAEQLEFLGTFTYANELADVPADPTEDLQFYLNNSTFGPGDAEYWYQILRALKPRTIIEIGSGNSTLMAVRAVQKNREEDRSYTCKHICIEPFEMPWLERSGVTVLREKVEEVGLSLFSQLNANDILFIDSSHVIRPQGDVLFEFLELLPTLNNGVIVHIHDIFTPRNYPKEWLADEVRLWNEQYLLEAFLTHNHSWKILGALNLLHHNHYEELKSACPYLTPAREPGSFYIQKLD